MRSRTNLWASVEKIILDHYSELITERMRDSYYITREYLNEDYLEKHKITKIEYEHFLTNQGYSTYRDDLWSDIEQKRGLDRPDAKPLGVIYSLGQEMTISQFNEVYHRVRGFIFVEKGGEAEDIKELSNHGWAVVAGQGYSTRLMRKLFKEDNRPVLVLHDADTAGNWIYKIFDIGSRRTKHLELWLNNVTDLGLNEQDAILLGLPSQPEAKRYKKQRKIRYELSAFSVVKHRWGLRNPVLAYTVAKMKEKGIRITPQPETLKALIKEDIQFKISRVLKEFQEGINRLSEMFITYAENIADELSYPEGVAVEAGGAPFKKKQFSFQDELFDEAKQKIQDFLNEIKPQLISEAQQSVYTPWIIDVDTYEQTIIANTDAEKILKMLSGDNK